MEYKKIESSRKTVALQINDAGELIVRCPFGCPTKRIEEFIEKNRRWIDTTKEKMAQRVPMVKEIPCFYYFGKSYPIKKTDENTVTFQNGVLTVPQNAVVLGAATFLRSAAKSYLSERVSYWAVRVGKTPTGITITSAKHRWGSASGKNRISFPWRVMLLPETLIDYVIVHELSHLWEHNHSSRFYDRVLAVLPDYKAREREIRIWEEKLKREGWYYVD